jgi:hypothetical protein
MSANNRIMWIVSVLALPIPLGASGSGPGDKVGTTILVSPNGKSFIDMLQHVSDTEQEREQQSRLIRQKDETKILCLYAT